jgi:hypothetical protein
VDRLEAAIESREEGAVVVGVNDACAGVLLAPFFDALGLAEAGDGVEGDGAEVDRDDGEGGPGSVSVRVEERFVEARRVARAAGIRNGDPDAVALGGPIFEDGGDVSRAEFAYRERR